MDFKGRSIGKFITGTKAVNETNLPLNVIDLLKRNFTRAVPFEAFSFSGKMVFMINGPIHEWSMSSNLKKVLD